MASDYRKLGDSTCYVSEIRDLTAARANIMQAGVFDRPFETAMLKAIDARLALLLGIESE